MGLFAAIVSVVGLVVYILLDDPKPKHKKIGGKASPILFKSSLKTGGVDEKVVFKTLKDAGIGPSFLGSDLNEMSDEKIVKCDEFDKLIDSANKDAYDFMRNNPDSLGKNSVQNVLNDEQTFTRFPVVQEPCIVKVKSKKKRKDKITSKSNLIFYTLFLGKNFFLPFLYLFHLVLQTFLLTKLVQ